MNRNPSSPPERHFDSKLFSVLLSAMFVLMLGVAAAGWSEAGAQAAVAAWPPAHHGFA